MMKDPFAFQCRGNFSVKAKTAMPQRHLREGLPRAGTAPWPWDTKSTRRSTATARLDCLVADSSSRPLAATGVSVS